MELRFSRASRTPDDEQAVVFKQDEEVTGLVLEASVQLQVVCLQQQSFSLSSARTRIRTLVLLHGDMLPIPASSVGDQLQFVTLFSFAHLNLMDLRGGMSSRTSSQSADDDVTSCWLITLQKLSSFMHSGFI